MEYQAPEIESLFWNIAALIADWNAYPVATALLFTRWAGLVSFTPGFGTDTVGLRFRMALAVLMAGVMTPVIDLTRVPKPDQESDWAILLASEFLVGSILGLSVSLWISAARTAGQWAALISGLSMQTTYQPDMDGDVDTPPTAIGRLFSMLGLFLFFSARGPLRLLDLVDASLQACPPGELLSWPNQQTAELVMSWVGEAMALSLLAAWPIIVALTTAQIAVALAMRTQSLVLSLSLMAPTRLAVGLVILAASFAGVSAGLSGTLENWMNGSVDQIRNFSVESHNQPRPAQTATLANNAKTAGQDHAGDDQP